MLTRTPTDMRKLEGEIPLLWEEDAVEISGARSLLEQLKTANAKWGIVTSGTRPLVDGWLSILQLTAPEVLVTAEDVRNGKPDPACYRLGLKHLSCWTETPESPSFLLCVEDAPAGVRAGKLTGCKVIALATTHDVELLTNAGQIGSIPDLRSLCLKNMLAETGEMELEISDGLCLWSWTLFQMVWRKVGRFRIFTMPFRMHSGRTKHLQKDYLLCVVVPTSKDTKARVMGPAC